MQTSLEVQGYIFINNCGYIYTVVIVVSLRGEGSTLGRQSLYSAHEGTHYRMEASSHIYSSRFPIIATSVGDGKVSQVLEDDFLGFGDGS